MNIVINTPAGNIGKEASESLLRAKQTVTVISRHPEKMNANIRAQARLIEGSIDDALTLDRALAGADALLWVTPFAFDQPDYINWAKRTAQRAADAVKRHGVRRVVLVSSVGAQHESGVGPIACLPAIEKSFRDAAPNVMALRAGSFMENYLNDVGGIAATGAIYSARPAKMKIPMVAARDIAAKAVQAFLDAKWSGFRIVGVHGPADLDQIEAAQIISEGIGRPVTFVEVTVEQANQGMRQAGLPAFAADLLCAMYTGFRDGHMVRAEPRTAETTTETSLLKFSREVLKPAIDAVQARSDKS